MHRSSDYNQMISNDLKNPRYAKGFFLELLLNKDEPMSLEDVLIMVARIMGTTEFADFVGERFQNIDKFIKRKRKPKLVTLNKYLKPFGLETVISVKAVNYRKVA
jgi:DNA-binding phage protein